NAVDHRVLRHRASRVELERPAVADDDDATVAGQHIEILLEVRVGQILDDDVGPAPVREPADLVEVSGRRVIEDMMGALLADELASALGARRPDDGEPDRVRQLHGRHADATAGAVHEDSLPGHRAGLVEESAVGGRVRDVDGRALREGDRGRQRLGLSHLAHRELAVRAGEARAGGAGQVDAVTDLQLGAPGTDGFDDPGAVAARYIRKRRQQGVGAGTDVGLDGVDARRVDANESLALARLGIGNLFELQHLRPTELVHLDRLHVVSLRWSFAVSMDGLDGRIPRVAARRLYHESRYRLHARSGGRSPATSRRLTA